MWHCQDNTSHIAYICIIYHIKPILTYFHNGICSALEHCCFPRSHDLFQKRNKHMRKQCNVLHLMELLTAVKTIYQTQTSSRLPLGNIWVWLTVLLMILMIPISETAIGLACLSMLKVNTLRTRIWSRVHSVAMGTESSSWGVSRNSHHPYRNSHH